MKLKKKIIILSVITVIILLTVVSITRKRQVVEINIGYQSITAQTWGAIIIKDKGLFEQKLKEEYPGVDFIINWHDELSGSAINNNTLAHKYQLGYMGDMPCVINLFNSYENDSYDSYLLSLDARGEGGINQAVLVKKDSELKTVSDLAGKSISVPVGSSAHRMLLELLDIYGIRDEVSIVHQDIPTAVSMLETNKIDAIAVWEPYATSLVANGKVRLLACELPKKSTLNE